MYDCIVIGKGPCGISCAIYLKRFNYNVLVIGKDFGSLEKANLIENYYGVGKVKGIDLANNGVKQAEDLGIEVLSEEVIKIDGLSVETNKATYQTKSIFLATGRNKLVEIEGIDDKYVSYCAICDGFFYRNKKIAIIGSGAYMKSELDILKQFTNDITIFSDGKGNVENAINGKIERLFYDDKKNIVVDGNIYSFDGIFIANEATGANLSKHLGIIMKNNLIVTNDFMTNIRGIFAGGDATLGISQVAKAVSDGASASFYINKFLKEE